MSATTQPAGGVVLPSELIEQVRSLSADQKFALVGMIEDELDPPGPRTPQEVAELIRERSDEFHAGRVKSMTVEESNAAIRAEMRKLGIELP